MSEDAAPQAPPAPRRRMRWLRWPLLAVLALVIAVGGVVLGLDTDIGHRFVTDRIAALKPANGLRFTVGRIRGSIYSRATLVDVRVFDPQGLVFVAPRVDLDWRPFAGFDNRLEIRRLGIPAATLERLPRTRPTGRTGPILPGFDIRIDRLEVARLRLGPKITGVARWGSIIGRADIRDRRALVDLAARVQGSDRLLVKLDAAPDRDRFDIDVRASGGAGGVLAKLTGLARPLALTIAGDGRWSAWQGSARADVAGARVIDLALGNRSGRYTLSGAIAPATITKGKLQRLTTPRVAVNGSATLADRQLAGTLNLRSAALDVQTSGTIDLARSAYRDVRIRTQLLRPPALFPNMIGRNVELRVILDGAFATAGFDYRLTADRVQFDRTGFEVVRIAGRGRLSKMPVIVPVALSAARVTGVGNVAGGILRNLRLDGQLRVTPTMVTGSDLRFRSDKLKGGVNLLLRLKDGRYEVSLSGALGRYLIPGFGIVDVTSRLRLVPNPGGRGARLMGDAVAQVIRLDNAFFRSLAGGLPRLTTGLERIANGDLQLRGLVIVAPQIRIEGNGYRRRDGSFHFEGRGTQARYGPLTIRLDGRIERPTLDLTFDRPNEAMGLRDVRAHLDPTPTGFAFTASGGSRIGDFVGGGQILLPKGGEASIEIAALDAGGIKATGLLRVVGGPFAGDMTLAGRGLTGTLAFSPVDTVQRIEAHIDAASAQLDGGLSIRRGRLDAVLLLDPAGASIEASGRAAGIRRGALALSRFSGTASLRGGTGRIEAALLGSRGRSFDIRAAADVTPDRYSITAAGTVDRRALKLETPAVLTRDGDGWRMAATRLSFAGGDAEIVGRFGGSGNAVDATLARMPLAVLDIGYPGLALSGVASGKLSFAERTGAEPTGRMNMTVRGLSRAGLVLTSRPIDVGVAAVLQPGNAAIRAVMASGGKTIGRAQARLAPLGQGDLTARLANAALFAQLRYDGPADTLWRLTGIELFDLSGPVAIGADLGGRVNDPRIRGVLRTNGARIESAVTGTVLTNVQAAGRFGGSQLAIDSFAADAGKGGRVTGTGSFGFAAVNGFGIDLAVQAERAVMINRDDIAATVTGPLSFKSDGSGGVISGEVRLNQSRYRLGQAAAASAVPRLDIREINLPGGDEAEDVVKKPWRLAIHAVAADGLTVSGLGLSSEWSTDLRIAGAPDAPAITGRADLVRGNYEFAGREFRLERGAIRFAGEAPPNPALDIAANADSTGLSATIRVTGEALKPEISFASVPALPQDELLSRLLFGSSITNLSAPEALQLAAAVSALQNNGTGINPINVVRRAVGLDRLRILPPNSSVGRTTSVAAGKYITRRVYAEIITDGQGYSATQVEFQITRWLSLLSTISTLGRQSANVRVSKDY